MDARAAGVAGADAGAEGRETTVRPGTAIPATLPAGDISAGQHHAETIKLAITFRDEINSICNRDAGREPEAITRLHS